MSDNLKELKDNVDVTVPLAGGVASVKVINDNPHRKQTIDKVGRYTGFPFLSSRSMIAGVVPNGSFIWNTNAMNKNDVPFDVAIGKFTQDGNDIGRILALLPEGSHIHFKDFVGRSTILKFIGFTNSLDSESNPFYTVNVEGFAENTNYAYQVGEFEPCMIEFINLNKNQNNKIITVSLMSDFSGTLAEQLVSVINDTDGFQQLEDEIYLFNLTDSETNDTSQFIFLSGKGFWGSIGTPVMESNFIEILQYKKTPLKETASELTLNGSEKTIYFPSGTFTQSLITAIGNEGVEYEFINDGNGIITLDPNGSQTIDGELNYILPSKSGCKIKSNGTNWVLTSYFKKYHFGRTQWEQPISTTSIPDGTSFNLFTIFDNSNKVANGTDSGIYQHDIVGDRITTNWFGSVQTHEIRVVLHIAVGTVQTYNLSLRRFTDDTIIAPVQISRNADTEIISTDFMTYTFSGTDPFVTGGFYISLDNESGSNMDIIGSINVYIKTEAK